jgi:hypothetical protein
MNSRVGHTRDPIGDATGAAAGFRARRLRRELEGWRSLQGRSADGAIESDERVHAAGPVVDRSERGARRLGELYWPEVTRASRGVVRHRITPDGVELRLLGALCLLRFGQAQTAYDADSVGCKFAIQGGALARRAGGTVSFFQVGANEPELRAAVCGFVPTLRGPLYEHVQRRLHLAISRRYFRRLIDEAKS